MDAENISVAVVLGQYPPFAGAETSVDKKDVLRHTS